MMYLFDTDRSGTISFEELRRVLKILGGLKMYSRDTIASKKSKTGGLFNFNDKKKKSSKVKNMVGLLF